MPTHVALLRGINVGGGGKVPMAELRKVVTGLGHADVATYIQTGNIIFTPSHDDDIALASELKSAIKSEFDVNTFAVVLSKAELAEVFRSNPYPDEPQPRYVHAVFLLSEPDQGARELAAELAARAADKGSRDEATIIGKTLFLHTPDGFGTSDLARELLLNRRSNPFSAGTARNWATVTKLLA